MNLYQQTNALFWALWAPRFILRRQSTHIQPRKWNRHQKERKAAARSAHPKLELLPPAAALSSGCKTDRQTPAFGQARPELHQLACAQPGAMEICIQARKKNPGRNGWQQAQWAPSPEVGAEPRGGCCRLTLPLGRRRLLHSPGCCPPSSPTGPSTPVCHQRRAGGCRVLLATVRTRSEQKEHCATVHFSISRWKHLIRCKSPV